jgi:predicted secreted hydrolase
VQRSAPAPLVSVPELLGGEAGKGFERPESSRQFSFPQDHGPHPQFRTEWWYFTGNLRAPERQEFGYELTLFRQALQSPLEALQPRTSAWAARDAYMGHFAISDLGAKQFAHFEKLSRAALGLAGASSDKVWVEDWQVNWSSARDLALRAKRDGYLAELRFQSLKPPVLQGEGGLSRKGPEPGQASYYYSLTRLQTQGQLQTPRGRFAVVGSSWMDREWSTRPLSPNLSGWDWFALQLDDGTDLMVYQLRDTAGQATSFSAGTAVSESGRSRHLRHTEVGLKPTGAWTSPLDGTRYPAGWDLQVPGYRLQVEPRLADQELSGLARYWEGSVAVRGSGPDGRPVAGLGYVELVGYVQSNNTRAK